MSGCVVTITPPFQNSNPSGLCTFANSIALSATPSPFSSGRISSESFIAFSGSHFGYVFQHAAHNRPFASTCICTGFANCGNCFSSANRFTSYPSGTCIFAIAVFPSTYSLGFERFDTTGIGAGTFASETLCVFPSAAAQIAWSRFAVIVSSITSSCFSTSAFVCPFTNVKPDRPPQMSFPSVARYRLCQCQFLSITAARSGSSDGLPVAVDPVTAFAITSPICRFPSGSRCTPFKVSGAAAAAYFACDAENKSTNATPFSSATCLIAPV